ncbi:MAG TPA: DUF4305 domain-containing protein [Bacillota bacterium]|nr:DUF4305 domain-containing protein [Bacillota bacterium]
MGYSFFYFMLGILFAVIAYNNATTTGTIFNIGTILLTAIAAIDIGMGFRYLNQARKRQNNRDNSR